LQNYSDQLKTINKKKFTWQCDQRSTET